MNIVFCGSPQFALPSLQALMKDHNILAVITQPSRPQGRGLCMQDSVVGAFAKTQGLKIFTPEKLRDIKPILMTLPIDIIVVVAYGKLIPAWLLQYPQWGCINVHASLLPRWRGASPIPYALMAGDTETGVSIMRLEEGMDTGGYWLQKSCTISAETSIDVLHDQLAQLGVQGLQEFFVKELYRYNPKPQDVHGVTEAPKLKAGDFSYDRMFTAIDIQRRLRAFYPKPGMRARIGMQELRLIRAGAIDYGVTAPPGTLMKIDTQGLWIATVDGMIAIQTLQLASQGIRDVASLIHGWPSALKLGEQLEHA